MPIDRSDDMVTVALFLSRCGDQSSGGQPAPPPQLGTSKWEYAYAIFFDALGEGRTLRSFHNSLKASRDQFDSHVESGRKGWWVGGEPKPLLEKDRRILDRWLSRSDDDLWEAVKDFADLAVADVPSSVLNDLKSQQEQEVERVTTGIEGKKSARISLKAERSPSLRAKALEVHGARCQVCGFDYGATYGAWGRGFIEIHHLELLADAPDQGREINPKEDLAAVCANCHRMMHRKSKIVLSIAEVRSMINPGALREWAEALLSKQE